MLIPRYWSRAEAQATTPDGRPVQLFVWRGSRGSAAEAQALADEAVARVAARVERGEGFPERYSYADRPLREEVIREIPGGGADTPDAAITRNAYGAQVLNTARAFFIDVDVDTRAEAPRQTRTSSEPNFLWSLVEGLPLPPALRSIAEQLLGPSPTASQSSPVTPMGNAGGGATAGALGRLRDWIAQHPDWRVRVYRTHAGLRYLVAHDLFEPTDGQAMAVMPALGADPQYIRLCQVQKSFRARLTPKPWRIHVGKPPARFPYLTPGQERAVRDWEAQYDRQSAGYATCQFLEEMGSGTEHPDVAPLRALHDEHTRATSGLPLA